MQVAGGDDIRGKGVGFKSQHGERGSIGLKKRIRPLWKTKYTTIS